MSTSSPGQRYNHLHPKVPYTTTAVHDMQYHIPTQPVPWNPIDYKHNSSGYSNHALGCVDCNTECTQSSCATTELTSQCTDQCVVIACNDPEHASFNCNDDHSRCDFVCDSAINCTDCNGFDAFLRCCEDARYIDGTRALNLQGQQQKQQFQAEHYDWETALSDALCNCRQPAHTGKLYPASTSPTTSSHSDSTPVPSAPINSSVQHSSSLAYCSPSTSRPFGPLHSPLSSSQTISQYGAAQNRQTFQTPYLTCMWGNCQARFSTLAELVGHVNLQHLRTTAPTPTSPNNQIFSRIHTGSHVPNQHTPDPIRFPCLWRNCTENLSDILSSDPTKWSATDLMSVMANHLLQEHLGVQSSSNINFSNYDNTPIQFDRLSPVSTTPRHQDQGPQNRPKSSRFGQSDSISAELDVGSAVHHAQPTCRPEVVSLVSTSSAATLPCFSPVTTNTSTVVNSSDATPQFQTCRWESCRMAFKTCNELTAHIAAAHIGSGKPRYDCLWEGCGRNGENGFSSKQKICRHLQSHTGYRPFQCPECHQNFSEAATLQQHIRRHTQEKPYVCDYPGCGKSFAITGALTIHKRVHNGSKPFKCTYCDRAFAESSNLSKHLRTHTGERPYKCLEPGCGKAFARPDQLTRHMGVHGRKKMTVVALAA